MCGLRVAKLLPSYMFLCVAIHHLMHFYTHDTTRLTRFCVLVRTHRKRVEGSSRWAFCEKPV